MKTTMKLFTYGLVLLTLIGTSCSKDGEVGPAGTAGTSGIDGTNGTDGADGLDGANGNANVQLLEYGVKTFTGSTSYSLDGISVNDINNNLFLAFYGRVFNEVASNGGILEKTQWIPVPGIGENGLFETNAVIESSSFASNSEYIVSLYDLDGSPHTVARSFRKFKIFIITPSTTGKRSTSQLSKMSYEELVTYLDLQE